MLLSKCVVCGCKISKFIQEQEASTLLSQLGIRTHLSKIPLWGDILWGDIKKFLLAGDRFMSEMHWKQPEFRYSACGPLTKNKTRIQKFKATGDSKYVYKNELDKACFQHDVAYADFKDLPRRTVSDKVTNDKTFEIASNPK